MTDERRDDPLLGREIDGRFRLDRLLGKGGMGRVYSATQLSVERDVAIKVLRDEISDSDIVERRFFREAKIAASIRHPNVVNIIDFGRDTELDALYIVMEFVEGRSLATLLKRGRLRLPLALHVGAQICSGLAEAHAAGIIHRDLKPDNVMLQTTAEGAVTARLLDFGIALPSGKDTRFTAAGAVVGTPHYMSPEQAQDQELDGRSDLHALGVMLYEMITGRLPWVAETPMAVLLKVVSNAPPPLGEVLPPGQLPPEPVAELLESLLSKDPAGRPPSADAAGRRFREIALELDATLPSMPTLDALSEAEVIDRASDELLLAGTATMESSPVPERTKRSVEDSSPPPERRTMVEEAADGVSDERPRDESHDLPPTQPSTSVRPPLVPIVLAMLLGGAVVALFLRGDGSEDPSATAVTTHSDIVEAPVRDVVRVTASGTTTPPTDVHPAEPPEPVAKANLADPAEDSPPNSLHRPPTPAAPTTAVDEARPSETGKPAHEEKQTKKPVPEAESGDQATTATPREVPAEQTPPVDDQLLGTKIRLQGGFCPDNEDCNFSPEARHAVCRTDSRCTFDCTRDGCSQQCQGDADCAYDCTGSGCYQICQGRSTCKLTCPGGGCIQYCREEATCTASCAGGGCTTRSFDDAKMRVLD